MKFFKGKKTAKKEAKPTPRALEEIKTEYNTVLVKAGQAQYQANIYSREVEHLNKQLENLNYEASARNQLDQTTAAPAETSATNG